MALTSDLISQFVKVTNDKKDTKKETTVLGTAVEYNGQMYIKLDGSEMLTPIGTTTSEVEAGERVIATVKDHSVTITGNVTSPSVRNKTVSEIGKKISEFEIIVADKVDTLELQAQVARIDSLEADNVIINQTLTVNKADISDLKTSTLKVTKQLEADSALIKNLEASKLSAEEAQITYATITNLEAANAKIDHLTADYGEFENLTTNQLSAIHADIANLDAKYANVDFTNIGKAAMQYFYANSGLIQNVVVGDATISGELVGVTISGDRLIGNTIIAEKLVIKGEDGLYYKLNTDGMKVEAEQTDYNSLNGQVIRAKSVTAEKIAVEDLVAFGATIGGFKIGTSSIFSGVKESVDNGTRGIYMDNQGQIAFGDGNSYIKYYKDESGNYKLVIAAESLTWSSTNKNVADELKEIQKAADAAIISSIEQYYSSTSPTELVDGEWSIVQPVWEEGRYIWRRTKNTYGDTHWDYVPSEDGVCISGNTGVKGEDSVLLRLESSRGTVFKNDQVSTRLSAVIYKGSYRITDSAMMKQVFGNGAYLQWKWQRLDEETFGIISSTDSRFSNDGFTFELSPDDVDTKVTFMCELII